MKDGEFATRSLYFRDLSELDQSRDYTQVVVPAARQAGMLSPAVWGVIKESIQ